MYSKRYSGDKNGRPIHRFGHTEFVDEDKSRQCSQEF